MINHQQEQIKKINEEASSQKRATQLVNRQIEHTHTRTQETDEQGKDTNY